MEKTQKNQTYLVNFDDIRVTEKSEIPEISTVVKIRENNFAIESAMSLVSGLPKSGKTTFLRNVIITGLAEEFSQNFDNLHIRTRKITKKISYINTELPLQFLKNFHDGILSTIKSTSTPKELDILNFLPYNPKERKSLLRRYAEETETELIIIDGAADLVNSINDENECNDTIEEIIQLAAKSKTSIIQVVHLNKGNNQTRGHYGQQSERKCHAAISLRKDFDSGQFSICSELTRDSSDFPPIYFEYDENNKIVSIEKLSKSQKNGKIEEIKEKLNNCFFGEKEIEKSTLRSALMQERNPSSKSEKDAARKYADRFIDQCFTQNLITTGGSPEKIRKLF